ncbi:MAG TPA: hypothetical protein PKL04_08920, partial [Methanofastidiosum sp.]|nr:hypothetical protein [Methanofastidiosum sp.]
FFIISSLFLYFLFFIKHHPCQVNCCLVLGCKGKKTSPLMQSDNENANCAAKSANCHIVGYPCSSYPRPL